MLPLSSAELQAASTDLAALAATHAASIATHESDWDHYVEAGNWAAFLGAAREFDAKVMAARAEAVRQMQAVSEVLQGAAVSLAAIESDLDWLIANLDAATQHSPEFIALLEEIGAIGRAIDHVCAVEIALICTAQEPTSASLAEYSDLDLQAVHELTLATATPEVRELAAGFPEARLLPASDGVVLAFGDIETAPSVTTIVPGVGSADPSSWHAYAQRTQAIAGSAQGAAVLWLDYRAPSNLLAATATYPAAVGGDRLREFQAELRRRSARRGNEPHLTVLGHSYGTVVAGKAAAGGLNADALVLAGSPGVGIDKASELDLRGEQPRVIATTSPTDPIGLTVGDVGGVHGPDPADPAFGAELWTATGGHSSYWEDEELHRRLRELRRS